jgi:hypothetical protein
MSSTPQKKKLKGEGGNVCGYKAKNAQACTKPPVTRPQSALANGAVTHKRCAAHQPCCGKGCTSVVGTTASHQKSGYCKDHHTEANKRKKEEEKKQWAKEMIDNGEVDKRTRKAASATAEAYNTLQLSPPTEMKGDVPNIKTNDVLERDLVVTAGYDGVAVTSSSSSSNKKKSTIISMRGLNVFLLSGNDEPKEGTLRKVTKDELEVNGGRGGGALLTIDIEGRPTLIASKKVAILRDDLGKEFEEQYRAGESTRSLLFVDSKDEIEFMEKTVKVYLTKTVNGYVLGSDGIVRGERLEYKNLYFGVHPESDKIEIQNRAGKWFDLVYPGWAKKRVEKGESVTKMEVYKEFEHMGVSIIYMSIFCTPLFILC